MDRRAYLISNLTAHRTVAELRRSEFYRQCSGELESLLSTPEVVPSPAAGPRLQSFLRIAQWNIEKGKQLGRIIDTLRADEILRHADIILLNEADHGMARSGNLHVARAIAERLNMHLAFAPAHIELTRGTEADLLADCDNRESLQGNAVLSSYPVLDARVTRLPVCFEPYEFHEKRYGRRNCLWARLAIRGHSLWVGVAHLEVRETPRCRARQMRRLLAESPAGAAEPCLLGGDFNSSGFHRGTAWRTLRSVARLLTGSDERVKERLLHPEQGPEPLFSEAHEARYSWQGLNDGQATASAPIEGFEDANLLPPWAIGWLRRKLAPFGGYLELKLDWLMARNAAPLARGELHDPERGVTSHGPGHVDTVRSGAERISDHSPIFADIRVPNT